MLVNASKLADWARCAPLLIVPRLIAPLLIAGPLAGCDTTLPLFVGAPKGQQAAPAAPVPPPTQSFASSSRSGIAKFAGSRGVLPPTPVAEADLEAETSAPVVPTTSHPPIATAPLSPDPAALAPLGAAAKTIGGDQARFVLLVITPPPANAAAIGQNGTASQNAATAALKALSAAGIAADRVEVSAATAPVSGSGEMRLYVR